MDLIEIRKLKKYIKNRSYKFDNDFITLKFGEIKKMLMIQKIEEQTLSMHRKYNPTKYAKTISSY